MEDESGRIRPSQRPNGIWAAMASFPGNFNRNRITSDHNSIHPFAVPSRLSKNHCLSSFRTGISDLPLGCEPIYPHSPPLAILPASDSIPKPQACPARPLPGPRNHHLPFFEAISRTPLPQLHSAVQIGFAWLSRLSSGQWQSQNSPQHASKPVQNRRDVSLER